MSDVVGSERPVPDRPPTAADVAALPEVLSSEQAAWLLQVTPGRLEAAARRGELPSGHVGRRRIYAKSALLEWITADVDPGRELR